MTAISVIGNVQADLLVSPVEGLPPPGGDLQVSDISLRAAGAAANTAFALAELGVAVRLIGCVGEDRFGRWIVDDLRPAGLADEVRVLPGQRTGISVACEAPARDRCFLTFLGSMAAFDRSMVPGDALAAPHVLLCGYFCLPAVRGAVTGGMLADARRAGATTLFDTGWDAEGWPAATRAEVLELLPLVDVFLPNEVEASALADEEDPTAAARSLQAVSGGWVVVKLGPRGCLAVGPGGRELAAPAPAVTVADTTGAGDVFNAGLMRALSGGEDWPAALHAATDLASRVVARPSSERYRRADAA